MVKTWEVLLCLSLMVPWLVLTVAGWWQKRKALKELNELNDQRRKP